MLSHISILQQELGSLDALLLTDPISIRYASGFFIEDGAAVITRKEAFLITDSRYTEAAEQAVRDMKILTANREKPLNTLLQQLLASQKIIGAEETRMSHGNWIKMEAMLTRSLVPTGDLLPRLRASKDEEEFSAMIAAQRIAEKAFNDMLGILRPGLTEKEATAELIYRMFLYGGEANSFEPIVIAGKKTSMPHGVPGDNVIKAGDFVTLDFGTMVHGYCSDMTRTVAIGFATEEMRKIYDIVLDAQLAGIAAAKPGATGKEIDGAARIVIEKAGYGEYFGHSFGHSLGLEIHESPNASPGNNSPMPAGAVFSAEPGIYLPGVFGVRIEDVLRLRDSGAEDITQTHKELLVL